MSGNPIDFNAVVDEFINEVKKKRKAYRAKKKAGLPAKPDVGQSIRDFCDVLVDLLVDGVQRSKCVGGPSVAVIRDFEIFCVLARGVILAAIRGTGETFKLW